ncbi:DNA-binding MarR family transcriptional regulator [Saccharopolyspora lacisalsi]|uniref:DNA-binding MarR family transcriptional regulator n=1 Tax=Halosaccharopolyspora lacisalsi TaxID=1000566 RepID=A0A839DWC8_9PSEU|nr:MarR family transcriptional regulator [Halosaccharopolyspora lacisalsi]MBA8824536.1 DNA-binding MarR family transcriptional regulator [Halosaccharopolyspora lacisalsi]
MELDNAVFHLLRRALQEHTANWQAQLPRMTKPQYAVLRAVYEHPGLEQAALGQLAAIDKATLASLLLRLEQRGLLLRTVDAGDRRRRLLQLTDEGRATLEQAAPVADSVDSAMLERLHLHERDQLRQLLGKLTAPPESAPEAESPGTRH